MYRHANEISAATVYDIAPSASCENMANVYRAMESMNNASPE